MSRFQSNIIAVSFLILILSLSRLIPHPVNFTPIISMAVVSGMLITRKSLALLIPLAAMFISDLFIGLHSGIPVIYFAISLAVLIGWITPNRPSYILRIMALSISVLVFYLITNFAVWYGSEMYSHDFGGLISCYIMGIPFVQNTFLSTIVYGTGAFVIYDTLSKQFKLSPTN